MRDQWKTENDANIATYNHLVREHGRDFRAADWGSRESQESRFHVLFECGIGASDSVLDVGCGLGDFFGWLCAHGFRGTYCGLDIAQEMIRMARQRFELASFVEGDILDDAVGSMSYDCVVASGLFAKRPGSGHPYLEAVAERMFTLCTKAVAFNSLSTWTLSREEHEFHADPLQALAFCRTLTPRVVLRADYHPRDFTIYMYKGGTA